MRVRRFFSRALAVATALFAAALMAPAVFAQSDASTGSPMSPTSTANAPGRAYFNGQKFDQESGVAIYENVCQSCHMQKAKGAAGAGAYPSLAQSNRLASAPYVVATILNGRNAMPPVGEALDDAQVAQVVNYIRTSFGNHYTDAVTAADVKAARPLATATAPASH